MPTPAGRKGSVENANGRLRRHRPRDLDLDALDEAELQEIILTHNLTPRKCLGFLTPAQARLKELGRDVQIRFASLRCTSPRNPPTQHRHVPKARDLIDVVAGRVRDQAADGKAL